MSCCCSRKKVHAQNDDASSDGDDGGFYKPAKEDNDSNNESQQPFDDAPTLKPNPVEPSSLDNRPRCRPNQSALKDGDDKAKLKSMSALQPHHGDVPLSPVVIGGCTGDESQLEIGRKEGKSDGIRDTFDSSVLTDKDRARAKKALGDQEDDECASSISSRSLSSILNQFPDSEARQPLLFGDEEDDEEVDTTVIHQSRTEHFANAFDNNYNEGDGMDLTPRASPVVVLTRRSIIMRSNSSVHSTSPDASPPPPPLPFSPPPDSSESEFSLSPSSSRSVSVVSRGRLDKKMHTCFDRKMNMDGGGYSLSLVDMSGIRYADSASSCCSDIEYQNNTSRESSGCRDPNYFQADFDSSTMTNRSIPIFRPRPRPCISADASTSTCPELLLETGTLSCANIKDDEGQGDCHSRSTTPTPPPPHPPTMGAKISAIKITLKQPSYFNSADDVICRRKGFQRQEEPSFQSYPQLPSCSYRATTTINNFNSNKAKPRNDYEDEDDASLVSSSRSIANPFQPRLQSIEEFPTHRGMRDRTQSEGIFPVVTSKARLATNNRNKLQKSDQPGRLLPTTGQADCVTQHSQTDPVADPLLTPLIVHSESDLETTDSSWLALSSLGDSNYKRSRRDEDKCYKDDPEKYSPSSSPNLSQLSYDELCGIKSEGRPALDLASQSNVQDAFVIAVEQQARERLEKLSALKRIKPVDMTKLSHQLSEVPSGGDTSELNGLIEAATGSPIYVTSASELSSSSQSALHRTAAGSTTGGGGGGGDNISDRSPLRSVDGNNVTVVGVNSTSSSSNHHLLPATTSTTAAEGDDDEENVLTTRAQVRKALPNGQYPDTARKSSSRDSINSGKTSGGSRESIDVEGAKSSSSRGRGGKLNSSRESVADPAQYANMINMVEWDNNGPHREMAVDVPESFVPRNKTPPRYPPNKASTLNASNNNNKPALTKTVSSGGGVAVMSSDGVGVRGNGTLTGQNGATKPVPPPRIGDNKETGSWSSVNNNNTQIPYVHPRTIVSPSKTGTAIAATTPSRDEAERIRKYQEELKKRREQEEQHAKEQEFLRTSIRGSKKLQALESGREESPVSGFVNDAYDDVDEDRIPYPHPRFDASTSLQKPVGLTDLVASLHRVQQTLKKNGLHLDETVSAVGTLMQTPEFQQILAVHNKVQDVWCFNAPPTPFSAHAHQLVQEVSGSLYNCSVPESVELTEILSRVDLEGVLYSHDKIAERERLLMTNDSATGESVDADPVVISSSIIPVVPQTSLINPPKPSVRPFVSEPQPDDRIKVVRIEKTQDPLGATVRNQCLHGSNDLDAVVIGRIVKGGAAERSGLLHEGDEILEVNGLEMRGKGVNEVCEILSRLTGTLTFLIVPTQSPPTIQQRRDVLIHVRAHFDYDPEDDQYLPCRELGIAFSKGDVLHVINQDDPSWWQAHREGEEDQALAGLIPSKSFQEQRCTLQQQLLGETETREKSRKGTLLCAKSQKKKKKKIPYSSAFNDDFDAEEIPTYEEVSLYYPRTSFKRPVVLIGPPNIGRHELRQRLMQESERFAAAVPHTSRTKKDGEIDGQDYHFISRAQFESDILGRKFVEHGEFEKAYYGTSLDAIRSVVNLGKICVLNLHPQSLKMLRNSDLRPYIVFVAPPPLERLKQMRIARGEAYKEEELIDIIEKAREMDEKYGHYFDLVIINNEIERTYHELLQRINYTEREPQWVPAFWEVKVGS
ncbi:uncharacterized protein LOC110845232 isoform X2 [Folsomia candida]|uniref:uncharacterized protein LOC110845232 isoform X2 n=1 Tax=Folsomia candida TaxID=158441 RepID=UPI001604EA65|nr:uncharacterized protein LOC110845232 isoform X2 [Folsomia candida]